MLNLKKVIQICEIELILHEMYNVFSLTSLMPSLIVRQILQKINKLHHLVQLHKISIYLGYLTKS